VTSPGSGAAGVALWALLGALAAGCGDGGPADCAAVGPFDCSNAVNAVLLPRLAREHVTPRAAGDAELCRRYGIDLNGAPPAWQDYLDHCAGRTPGEMVDWFMAQPGYIAASRRVWADALGFDNITSWYRYLADLGRFVDQLYGGQLRYADFAAVALAHPAFVSKYAGENVVAYGFQAFLGRDALPEERQDVLGLYRMWRLRSAYDPALTRFRYQACTRDADCDTGRACLDGVCQTLNNIKQLFIDPARCSGAIGELACSSTLLGTSVQLDHSGTLELDALSTDDWGVLQAPGRALATLPAFWEAGVDAVLHRYLGWWHGGYQLPGYELADVRQTLATRFSASGGDLPALEREVLTSALYTMAADEPAGDVAFWHYGPTKQMTAESWLDGVAAVTGTQLGSCDPRFPNISPRWLPPAMVPAPATLAGFDYAHEARLLGGCPDQLTLFRATDVGVLTAMEQRSIVATACTQGTANLLQPPAGADPGGQVQAFYRQALTWDPPADEVAAVAALLPAGGGPTAAVELCQAVLRSSRFLFY
jgi:hypothetical protein